MLLDFPGHPIEGEGPWRRAVPGGERVVSLVLADRLFDPGLALAGIHARALSRGAVPAPIGRLRRPS